MKLVLVCGGRNFIKHGVVRRVLDQVAPDMVLNGGSTGADALSTRWAKESGTPYAVVPALWDYFGPSAGPRRNTTMLWLKPSLVIAFPGNEGTADMVKKAKAAGIEVREVSANERD